MPRSQNTRSEAKAKKRRWKNAKKSAKWKKFINEDGEAWITEEEAETVCGVPREILRYEGGRGVYIPSRPRDRQIRRTIILAWLCVCNGVDCLTKVMNGRVLFREELFEDVRLAIDMIGDDNFASLDDRQRAKRIATYALLSLVLPELGKGFFDVEDVLGVLAKDALMKSISPRENDEEWDRYHEGTIGTDCR